jgi:hypothetical protein
VVADDHGGLFNAVFSCRQEGDIFEISSEKRQLGLQLQLHAQVSGRHHMQRKSIQVGKSDRIILDCQSTI